MIFIFVLLSLFFSCTHPFAQTKNSVKKGKLEIFQSKNEYRVQENSIHFDLKVINDSEDTLITYKYFNIQGIDTITRGIVWPMLSEFTPNYLIFLSKKYIKFIGDGHIGYNFKSFPELIIFLPHFTTTIHIIINGVDSAFNDIMWEFRGEIYYMYKNDFVNLVKQNDSVNYITLNKKFTYLTEIEFKLSNVYDHNPKSGENIDYQYLKKGFNLYSDFGYTGNVLIDTTINKYSDSLYYPWYIQEEYMQNQPFQHLNLSLSQSILLYYAIKNPHDFIRRNGNNDNRFLSFLDTLSYSFAEYKNLEFIQALNEIDKYSDGSVGEALESIAIDLIKKVPNEFLKFLYSDKDNSESNLQKEITWYLQELKKDDLKEFKVEKTRIRKILMNLKNPIKKYYSMYLERI
ncbi:hypothetical protein BH10BAC5_BH10BAC5_14890 [soil metagenome]